MMIFKINLVAFVDSDGLSYTNAFVMHCKRPGS
jgi:hypothetical protein